jgi:hypothetical protein
MRWTGHVARIGGERRVYRVLVGKSKERDHSEDRRRWVNEIGMDLGEITWKDVDWIKVTHDRGRWRAVVNAVMKLRVLAPRIALIGWLVS